MKKLVLIAALSSLLFSFQTMAIGEHRKGKASEHSKADKYERKVKKYERKLEKKITKKIKKEDVSGDGKIDLSEFLTAAEARFIKLDRDSDGYVTEAELREKGYDKLTKLKEKMSKKIDAIESAEQAR